MMNLETTDQKQEFHWKIENSAKLPAVKMDTLVVLETALLRVLTRVNSSRNSEKSTQRARSIFLSIVSEGRSIRVFQSTTY